MLPQEAHCKEIHPFKLLLCLSFLLSALIYFMKCFFSKYRTKLNKSVKPEAFVKAAKSFASHRTVRSETSFVSNGPLFYFSNSDLPRSTVFAQCGNLHTIPFLLQMHHASLSRLRFQVSCNNAHFMHISALSGQSIPTPSSSTRPTLTSHAFRNRSDAATCDNTRSQTSRCRFYHDTRCHIPVLRKSAV